MEPRGQPIPRRGDEIPEKNWLYRLAKRFFFNDFGAYDRAGFQPTTNPSLQNDSPKVPSKVA